MSWSIGCCFVCLFFDYFFSVQVGSRRLGSFFMSMQADASLEKMRCDGQDVDDYG